MMGDSAGVGAEMSKSDQLKLSDDNFLLFLRTWRARAERVRDVAKVTNSKVSALGAREYFDLVEAIEKEASRQIDTISNLIGDCTPRRTIIPSFSLLHEPREEFVSMDRKLAIRKMELSIHSILKMRSTLMAVEKSCNDNI